ncbi:hypothetical protein Tco_1183257 [Tanacetum coccineum]
MKPLPTHLEYAYLEKDSLLLVIIAFHLKVDENERLVSVLKNYKEDFAWKTSNIPGISSNFCKHKINFKDDGKLRFRCWSSIRTTQRKALPSYSLCEQNSQ